MSLLPIKSGKTCKYQEIKDLALTNCHWSEVASDIKWRQVVRAENIRCFFVPEFCSQPSLYHSHHCERVPRHCANEQTCNCEGTLRRKVMSMRYVCKAKLSWNEQQIVSCLIVLVRYFYQKIVHRLCPNRFGDNASLEARVNRGVGSGVGWEYLRPLKNLNGGAESSQKLGQALLNLLQIVFPIFQISTFFGEYPKPSKNAITNCLHVDYSPPPTLNPLLHLCM